MARLGDVMMMVVIVIRLPFPTITVNSACSAQYEFWQAMIPTHGI
jgi:hypothetical protein